MISEEQKRKGKEKLEKEFERLKTLVGETVIVERIFYQVLQRQKQKQQFKKIALYSFISLFTLLCLISGIFKIVSLWQAKSIEKAYHQLLTLPSQKKLQQAQEFLNTYPEPLYQEKVSRLITTEIEKLIKEANLLLENKEYLKSIEKFEIVLKHTIPTSGILSALGIAYFENKNYEMAKKYLELSKDPTSQGLKKLALTYAALDEVDKAIQILEKAIKQFQQEKNGENELISCYTSLGSLYEKKNSMLKSLEFYRMAVGYIEKSGHPGIENKTLYAKLGILTFPSDKQEAFRYLKVYRTLGGDDFSIVSLYLSLLNFTPLKSGRKWKYQIKTPVQKIYRAYEIVNAKENKFLIQIDGKIQERWSLENNFYKKQEKGKSIHSYLKYPIELNATWINQSGLEKWEYKIVSINEKVVVPAGNFEDCIKVEASEITSSKLKSCIHYAPEVGEVKLENFQGNQVILTKELVSYSY